MHRSSTQSGVDRRGLRTYPDSKSERGEGMMQMVKRWAVLLCAAVGLTSMLTACGGGEQAQTAAVQATPASFETQGLVAQTATVCDPTPASDYGAKGENCTNAVIKQMRALSAGSARTIQSASTPLLPDVTALMNWAESRYPEFFPSKQSDISIPEYIYRYYPETGNYLGVARGSSAGDIYVLGPMANGVLTKVGAISDYPCTRFAGICVLPVNDFSQGLTTAKAFPGIQYISPGPDGNMWFTERDGNRIGRITPQGQITEFSNGLSSDAKPRRIVAGPDGNMWFTEEGAPRIGRITMNGVITEFSHGIHADAGILFDIAAGSDGNLWFTEAGSDRIGRITPTGDVSEFSIGAGSSPSGIARGPDGNMWFTEQGGSGKIGKITPQGALTEFSLGESGSTVRKGPIYIVSGPDGNMWFTERIADRIGRISTAGVLTEFPVVANSNPWDIAVGPDGNLWYTEDHGVSSSAVWRITTAGVTSKIVVSGDFSLPRGIATGSDGNLWLVQLSNSSDSYRDSVLRVTPSGDSTKFSTGITSGVGGSRPINMVAGLAGDVWFTEGVYGRGQIGLIHSDGHLSIMSGYHPDYDVGSVAAGLDGSLYLGDFGKITKFTTAGEAVVYSLSDAGTGWIYGIATSPDGSLWFVDHTNDRIGRVAPGGSISYFATGISLNAGIYGLVAGSDGNIWFTENAGNRIGKLTPQGVVTEFSSGLSIGAKPTGIVSGLDGNMWFLEHGTNRIGRITQDGVITEFGSQIAANADLRGLTVSLDGSVWFTEYGTNLIGTITPAGVITEFSVPGLSSSAGLSSIVAASDGRFWFAQTLRDKIGNFVRP